MFTIGDLIVFLAVCVILAIFRRSDRTNRAISAVKRAADKASEDLGHIIAERSSVLKDMAIELEVNQRAGSELLRTIRASEEALAASVKERTAHVAALEERLKRVTNELKKQEQNRSQLQRYFQEIRA